jgi:hypothetical protein
LLRHETGSYFGFVGFLSILQFLSLSFTLS